MSTQTGFDLNKYLGRGPSTKKTEEVVKYNERRFNQAALFYGCVILTYLSSKIAYRGVVKRRYNPTFFQHNNLPPRTSFYKDALCALGDATMLAVTSMATFTTGTFWYFDISNLHEFGYNMRNWLGGKESEEKLRSMPEDKETEEMGKKLTEFINNDKK